MHALDREIDRLGQLIAQGEQIFMQWAKQKGINYNQFAILDALYRYQSCTQKQICEQWALPKQTVSTLCRQLQQQGDIVLQDSLEDKREKQMSLTAQGKDKIQALSEDFSQMQHQAFARLGTEKTEQTIANMRLLNQYFLEYIQQQNSEPSD
ncbi:MarR family winged helix-turn-helix transcriptional regulator [Volucribacter amazonae]|uniref:HTH marR-type domain-containing protein n=1 Tax=Volucribacter amazonae TaxID=256731 RepID=A0A9X4PDT9_9PAST|nr:MarR family transcriptional regulator [Volucribacter amazonae]MDG6895551.1 hypothetical protein [Volucribacter amazonae]